MTPKAARNLSAVAFVALFVPCRNLLTWLDLLFISFGAPPPVENLMGASISVFGPVAIWLPILLIVLLAFLASLALYRYLRRRDFPQICTDCATRKPLVWIFFLLFAFLSIIHPSVTRTSVMAPSDYTACSDEDFVCYDESFDVPEDAPPSFLPETQNATPQTPEVPQ